MKRNRVCEIIFSWDTTPLFSQSKLLCFSLLYLSSSLLIALFSSLSKSKCQFRSSLSNPIQTPLSFSYPHSYGQSKYAIPTLRTTCSFPVFFSDYSTVVKDIEALCKSPSSSSLSGLKYLKGRAETFGGNFSHRKRFSYFDHQNETSQIPCGFFKDFPISDSDRNAMENCRSVVVVSAIFNDHDKLRQPKGLGSKTLENTCFFVFVDDKTLRRFEQHKLLSLKSNDFTVGVWKIVKVRTDDLYDNPAMNGVIPKYLSHRLFPNSKFSVWIDAKLKLMVDPLLLIESLVVSEEVEMAISKHPFYVHTMEEAIATARWNKLWDFEGLRNQMETYCEFGLKPWTSIKLPYTTDVPDSALILRKHDVKSNLFSCLMFNELDGFNHRDQLAFAFVRDHMRPKLKINIFDVQVFEHISVEYRHNLKPGGGTGKGHNSGPTGKRRTKWVNQDLLFVNGSCKNYLSEMWG